MQDAAMQAYVVPAVLTVVGGLVAGILAIKRADPDRWHGQRKSEPPKSWEDLHPELHQH
jgi:hypothetical protein